MSIFRKLMDMDKIKDRFRKQNPSEIADEAEDAVVQITTDDDTSTAEPPAGSPADQPAEPAESESESTEESETEYDSSPQNPDTPMEEIYSTKDKHVKYRRQQPLEAEAAAKRTAAAKDELKRGKLEFYFDDEPDAPEVKLEAELDPDAVVAEDIIEDIVDVKKLKGIFVRDIDDIDVSLEPDAYPPADTEKPRESTQESHTPSSSDVIVAKVPAYQHESAVDNIYLKAGRFTDVVESEYDEYLRSTDPAVSHNYRSAQPEIKPHQSLLYTLSQAAARRKAESEQKQKNKEIMRKNFDEEPPKSKKVKTSSKVEKLLKKAKSEQSKSEQGVNPAKADKPVKPPKESKSDQLPKKQKLTKAGRTFRVLRNRAVSKLAAPSRSQQERMLSYNSREDEAYISDRIRKNQRRLLIQLGLYALFTIVLLSLVIWERTSGAAAIAQKGAGAALAYCAVSTVLCWGMGIIARQTLIDGLKPLRRFKANSATLLSLAYIACLLQGIVSLFTSSSFVGADHHLYGFIIAFALALDAAGRLMMVLRVKSNFEFISAHSPAYAAELFDDQETARRMVSGTTASRGNVAYQHVTSFLSDFLKISYAPDPSEEHSGKTAPIAVISAVIVTILYAILFKSVQGAVSALTVMLCVGIPFTAMIAGNLPMLLFSHRMLDEDAMVAGYPSVRQFCDTSALILTAADLFPSGCVTIEQLVPLQQYRVEEGLLMAAAVLREAGSPIAPAFDELVMENKGVLPSVESVMYEDQSGLVGWIGGERVLIGNRKLMDRYHISIREDFPISKMKKLEKHTTYIAVSGQAVAVMALNYSAAPITKEQVQKAEHAGLALIVSTTDANVTDDLIASVYGLFHRSVKVTTPGYTNVIDEATGSVEEASRAFIATRGRIGSLARAIGGCIGVKTNINLGIAIEIFGTILGLILCATLALYASVARLSVVELIIYIGFWTAATVIAELIRRP